MNNQEKRTANRALTSDRPDRSEKLRVSHPRGPAHPCFESGHNTVFLRGDRYGCCTKCGNEMLT